MRTCSSFAGLDVWVHVALAFLPIEIEQVVYV